MDTRHATALDRAISPDRFGTYEAAAGGDRELARQLYVWDRDVAAAVLADIAIVEVALRNALNDTLTRMHGQEWYKADIGIDDRTRGQLNGAWRRLPQTRRTPGRVVAGLMLGFWVDLLDAGGEVGSPPQRWHVDHEDLWRAGLSSAFRGGRHEAKQAGEQFTRTWTHSTAKIVQALRNRAAHHEPLLNGVPLPGQQQAAVSRVSTADARATYLRLLRMIDRDLESWTVGNSNLDAVLARRPTS